MSFESSPRRSRAHGTTRTAPAKGVCNSAISPSAAPIVPGKSAASEMIRRILSNDPAERMPPEEANKTLTAEQKDLLRRWVEQGAEYQKHWAFEPPVKAAVPQISNSKSQISNPHSAAFAPVGRLFRLER